jgi:hypothetical protein
VAAFSSLLVTSYGVCVCWAGKVSYGVAAAQRSISAGGDTRRSLRCGMLDDSDRVRCLLCGVVDLDLRGLRGDSLECDLRGASVSVTLSVCSMYLKGCLWGTPFRCESKRARPMGAGGAALSCWFVQASTKCVCRNNDCWKVCCPCPAARLCSSLVSLSSLRLGGSLDACGVRVTSLGVGLLVGDSLPRVGVVLVFLLLLLCFGGDGRLLRGGGDLVSFLLCLRGVGDLLLVSVDGVYWVCFAPALWSTLVVLLLRLGERSRWLLLLVPRRGGEACLRFGLRGFSSAAAMRCGRFSTPVRFLSLARERGFRGPFWLSS